LDDQGQSDPQPSNGYSGAWSTLKGLLGFMVGSIAGFLLFVWTYPWNGSEQTPVWQISVFDGIVISTVGGLAYRFRKHSRFWQGIFISAALLFILNGLCGISGG